MNEANTFSIKSLSATCGWPWVVCLLYRIWVSVCVLCAMADAPILQFIL